MIALIIILVAVVAVGLVIGRADLDTLLSDRDHVAVGPRPRQRGAEEGHGRPHGGNLGLRIERVEIKDIVLPPSMMQSMSKQAETEQNAAPASSPPKASSRHHSA